MIATNEAVDVLRHGWQDAASTLAADVPEVAELLQARLEVAITTQRLDERHLLDTIQDVELVTSRAGSPSGLALARRLRRTVYEYLLALDAARPLEAPAALVDRPAAAGGSPMVGAEEVAALGHASRSRAGEAGDAEPGGAEAVAAAVPTFAVAPDAATTESPADQDADADEDPGVADAPLTRRRFALRRRQRPGAETTEAAVADAEAEAVADGTTTEPAEEGAEAAASEPAWQYTAAGEPAFFDGGAADPAAIDDAGLDPANNGAAATLAPEAVPVVAPDAVGTEPVPGTSGDAAAASADPAAPSEEGDAEASPDPPADPVPAFVAPRAGFHIVEDAPAHRMEHEETRLEMPAFSSDEDGTGHTAPVEADAGPAVAQTDPAPSTATARLDAESRASPVETEAGPAELAPPQPAASAPADVASASPLPPAAPDPGSDFLTWRSPSPPLPEQAAELHAPAPATAGLQPAGAPGDHVAAHATAVDPVDDEEDDTEGRGWGVRRHGDARTTRRGVPAVAAPQVEDDPFENNTRLSDMRRRIEERLRRKRCDEAAALLQEIAQETGGRAVAELAMNAGDRCRALGKSNAALNCYLAAARSDPVYELPLSRLADICIDNQDTELAVSYLERIARIYRFRGEDRSALRTYRRIATIAPYREDVLTLLMNAQRTGQLE